MRPCFRLNFPCSFANSNLGQWAGNHFKQLRLCKSDVGQDGIVTIPDQMFVIARQALAHTHFSASRLLMWPTVLSISTPTDGIFP